jgi:hypothetical protein
VARSEEARRWENDERRGEDESDRVSQVIHIGLGRVEKRRGGCREARARGKGEGARRSCK